MIGGQLALELGDVRPLVIHAACHRCPAVFEGVPVEGGPGAPWWEAVAWCLVALGRHGVEVHGDPPPNPRGG